MNETKTTKFNFASRVYGNKYFILTVIFIFVFCFVPLGFMTTAKGHDYGFHFQRIQALADEMAAGNFFPRIYSAMLDGNGYATPLFYGDLLLTIPAGLMVLFGRTLTEAYTFFIGFIFGATAISMYFCTVSVTKSKKAGFCGAVMYGLSSYLVTDLIQRAALGEAQAFIFIPIAFTGFYHIMYGEIKKWYLLPVGLAAMIYCHTLSSLVTVFVLFLFLLFSVGRIKENPFRLVYLGISVVLFFALAANFIFPMLEQLDSNEFLATDGYSASIWGTLEQRSMPWWAVFCDLATKVHSPYIPNGIGLAGIVFAMIYLYHNRKAEDKFIHKLLAVSAIILFMTTSLFPWELLQDVCGILQFPWRLLVFPTFFAALGAAMYFGSETPNERGHGNLMYLVIALSLCSYVCSFVCCGWEYFDQYINGTEITYDYVNKIGAAEYLPSSDEFEHNSAYVGNYKAALLNAADNIYTDGNGETSFERTDGKLIVEFKNMNKDNAYLDVPLLMYKGYTAYLDDGTELECGYGTYNRIRVNVGNVREGTVTFEYTGTTTQTVSSVITVVSVIALIAYLIAEKYISKKKENIAEQETVLTIDRYMTGPVS